MDKGRLERPHPGSYEIVRADVLDGNPSQDLVAVAQFHPVEQEACPVGSDGHEWKPEACDSFEDTGGLWVRKKKFLPGSQEDFVDKSPPFVAESGKYR